MALGLLAAATLAGVFALYRLGFGYYSLGALVVTVAVGALYLREYAQRPLRTASPSVPAPADDDEPFEDPVEEAARLDRAGASTTAPAPEPAAPEAPAAPPAPPAVDDGLETD